MFLSGLWSLQSFIWVSWGYLPSTDTMCRPQFYCFLPSFLCCYVFSKWNIYFFILVFPNLILFCPCLFRCNTFPVSYFLSFSCLSLHILYFLCLFPCLSSIFFLAVFYLSPLIFFVYHLLSISASVSFFVFYFPSWLSSTFFYCLSSIIFPLLFSLSFRVCVFYYYYYAILLFCILYLSVFLSAFSAYSTTFFFLFCFPYFALFSTLQLNLVLILDFNYCKFSLLFTFSINLLSLHVLPCCFLY